MANLMAGIVWYGISGMAGKVWQGRYGDMHCHVNHRLLLSSGEDKVEERKENRRNRNRSSHLDSQGRVEEFINFKVGIYRSIGSITMFKFQGRGVHLEWQQCD